MKEGNRRRQWSIKAERVWIDLMVTKEGNSSPIEQFLTKEPFPFPGPECIPKANVIDATPGFKHDAGYGNRFDHRGILQDGCEEVNSDGANYFVTSNWVTDAFLIFDLGCDVFVTTVQLKNVHNNGKYE